MSREAWDYGHFSGSGHAQSMLTTGQPLLSNVPTPKPVRVGGPWHDDAFPGAVTLWVRWTFGAHLEVRWKSRDGSAQGHYDGLFIACARLADTVCDWELDRLQRTNRGVDVEAVAESDPSRFPALTDSRIGLETWADRLVSEKLRDTAGDVGSWRIGLRKGVPSLYWRNAWQRRDHCFPLSVVAWVGTELPAIVEQLERSRSAAPADSSGS
jgi:hypothetical protein